MKKKRSEWLRLLWFLPLLVLPVFVNVYFDPANLFHNVSRSIADSLMVGNPTYISSGNMNERRVKERVIEMMPDEVDCIAVGASIMMGVRQEHVGTDNYYNLSMSGADFYDIVAQFGLMDIYEKRTDRVVFCVDPNFFDKALYDSYTRNIPFKPYAYYWMDTLRGGDAPGAGAG